MKYRYWISVVLAICSMPLINLAYAQNYIADYSVAKEEVLRSIPAEFIDKARTDLVVAYQHSLHGTHVSRGVFGLQDYKAGDEVTFAVSTTQMSGKLEFRDYALSSYAPSGVDASDLSRDETAFIQSTRNYLDAPENASVNVVMWAWCNIAGHNIAANYLPGMDALVSEYGPGGTKIGTGGGQRENPVTFVFMTGHANVRANTSSTDPKHLADLINNHCLANGYYCLDYYSIDTHDMDDNYWEDAGDNGNSTAYGGNYHKDWQTSHTLGVDFFENKRSPGGEVAYGAQTTQHITSNRKGYAFWWILARIAGWNNNQGSILVNSVQLSSEGSVTEMLTGESLQFSAEVLPADATNKEITWSVEGQTGSGTITQDGLLTATSQGTVNVVATAQDGSGTTDNMQIAISDPVIPVADIVVTTVGDVTEMLTGETLQFSAEVLPANATNKDITWSILDQTGSGTITQEGVLTAILEGTVTVKATAQDGSGTTGSLQITITDPVIPVTEINVSSVGDLIEIFTGDTLQLTANVLPTDATNKDITWSVSDQTGSGTITQGGILTAINPGTVLIVATAQDGSGTFGNLQITITDPVVPVIHINVNTEGDVSEILTGSTLNFSAEVLPSNATNKDIAWSVLDQTGSGTISQAGLLTATLEGTVLVVATAQDGSGISGSKQITITDPVIPVSQIIVSAVGGVTEVLTGNTLQFSAEVLPINATNKNFAWSVSDQTGSGTISQSGLLTATSQGTVLIIATAEDGSGTTGTLQITIIDPVVLVTHINVSTVGSVTEVLTGGTLHFSVEVLPANATNKDIEWSVVDQTGSGTITQSGLLTATLEGTVLVVATSLDGSGTTGNIQITIIDPVVPVNQITISSEGGITEVLTGGTLQFSAFVLPTNATNKEISWSVLNQTGSGAIDQDGLLTTMSPGTLSVLATAEDGSGTTGSMQITITDPVVPVIQINVSTTGNITEVLTGGNLQFSAEVLPSDATNQDITWSVVDQTGSGTITQDGFFTAMSPGILSVVATAQDGSGTTGSLQITISDPVVPVTQINVSTDGGVSEVLTGGTLQFSAEVMPANATNKDVTWSIIDLTGSGVISQNGYLTGVNAGTVMVVATAQDGSGITGSMQITITDPVVQVTHINITTEGSVTEVLTGGTIQYFVEVLPIDATNKGIIWSVLDQTGSGTISQDGLLTAVSPGTILVEATAQDGSGTVGNMQITIVDPVVPVTAINVITGGGVTEIISGSTLQCSAEVLPVDATHREISWSVLSQTGSGTITQNGLLTAVSPGAVLVVATAQDGSGVTGSVQIIIIDQVIPVAQIKVSTVGNQVEIITGNTLQFSAHVLPIDATNKDITWSVLNQSGSGTISHGGLLTAISPGTVLVTATAQDGSGITGSMQVTITNPIIPVSRIIVTSEGGVTEIIKGESLQFSAEVLPADATNKDITWSVLEQTGSGTINQDGVLTTTRDGTVTVVATSHDGSGSTGSMQIRIKEPTVDVTTIHIRSVNGKADVFIGGTLLLIANVLPVDASNKSIVWSIDNMSGVATIDQNGLLRAMSKGEVTVVATALDGSGAKGTMDVYISDQKIMVSSVRILPQGDVNRLPIGNSLQYDLYVLPLNASNRSVIWRVENITGDASITQGGLVFGELEGTVNVIAIALDGNGIRDTSVLSIIPSIMVDSIILTTESGKGEVGIGGNLQFLAEVLPWNATNRGVTWQVGNITGEASITMDGFFTALSPGTVEAIARAQDESGIECVFSVTIRDWGTEVEFNEVDDVSVYPNPGNHIIYLSIGERKVDLLQVLNMTGSVVNETKVQLDLPVIGIDLSTCPPGPYLIRLFSGDNVLVKQLIIAR